MWGVAARRADDEVLTQTGYHSFETAVKDAQEAFCDPDTDEVWVRRTRGEVLVGPVLFRMEAGPAGCRYCGWPPGKGHAPGARCDPSIPGHLLGRQVEVRYGEKLITTGLLLGFGEDGQFEVADEEGTVHYCWPMLDVSPKKQKEAASR